MLARSISIPGVKVGACRKFEVDPHVGSTNCVFSSWSRWRDHPISILLITLARSSNFIFLGCVARVENWRFRADHFRADHGGANYFDFGLCGQNRRDVICLNPYYRVIYVTKTKKKNNIKGLARGKMSQNREFGNQNGNFATFWTHKKTPIFAWI